jgi:hypothetical protein
MTERTNDEHTSDYDEALALGRRAYHDQATDTICSCPENYLLAVGSMVDGRRRWTPAVDVALLSRRGAIVHAIRMSQDNSAAEALADAIGKVLPPPAARRP